MPEAVYKILLIDDDPDFLEAAKAVLESKPDYEVVTASDGIIGLQMAKDKKPDLIILDVIMPAKDGFAVAKQLKEDAELQKIPIIMLTAFSQKVSETAISVAQGMSLEAEDYLEKPVSPQELLQRVDRLIERATSVDC